MKIWMWVRGICSRLKRFIGWPGAQKSKFNSEYLRPVEHICSPDSRNLCHSVFNKKGGFRPLELEDNYQLISKLSFNPTVPEDVVIKFETVKNLYLYSWFVYRFYPVSELYAYTCLEFSLRERFKKDRVDGKQEKEFSPGLRKLLTYAVNNGYIRNEGFEIWHKQTKMKAYHRTSIEKVEEMHRLGLKSIEFDESKIEIKDEDRNHDYLKVILETIPHLRNRYAHGSRDLHNGAYVTIKLVWEIINQIF
jgi:hypothetical protein